MRTKLSPEFIASAKVEPDAERTIFWDEQLRGFGLVVTARGHKSFCAQYRAGMKSRRATISITLPLGKARNKARAIFGDVAVGGDPVEARRAEVAKATNTLRAVAEEYFARERKHLRTTAAREAVFERLVYPTLGDRQIGEIKRSEIVKMLDGIEDENGPVMADRTLAYLRRILALHAINDDDFTSPIVRGMARTKPKERARKRTLIDAGGELKAVWNAAGTSGDAFGPLVKFLLLTATRRNESAQMRWAEIVDDVWTIPAKRYKTKIDHVVPLSQAAQALLAEVPKIEKCEFVFTSDGRRPVGGFSKFKREFDKACGVSGWRLHDLRRTARTLMSRAKVPSDHVERALGHVIGGVRETYDRHEYLEEKRAAFEALAATVEEIINPPENVIALRVTA